MRRTGPTVQQHGSLVNNMGKRSRAPKGSASQLLQLAQNGKFEQFAKSLVAQRVRIGKKVKGKTKPSNVREGLVRRSENEVVQKVIIYFINTAFDIAWEYCQSVDCVPQLQRCMPAAGSYERRVVAN